MAGYGVQFPNGLKVANSITGQLTDDVEQTMKDLIEPGSGMKIDSNKVDKATGDRTMLIRATDDVALMHLKIAVAAYKNWRLP